MYERNKNHKPLQKAWKPTHNWLEEFHLSPVHCLKLRDKRAVDKPVNNQVSHCRKSWLNKPSKMILHSLKLTVRPWKKAIPKCIPTIHFQVRAVSFREGSKNGGTWWDEILMKELTGIWRGYWSWMLPKSMYLSSLETAKCFLNQKDSGMDSEFIMAGQPTPPCNVPPFEIRV